MAAKFELRVEWRLRKAFEPLHPETVSRAIEEQIAFMEANNLKFEQLTFNPHNVLCEEYEHLVRMREYLASGQSAYSLAGELLVTDIALGILTAKVACELLPYALLFRDEHRSGLGIGVSAAWLDVQRFCDELKLVLCPSQRSAVRAYVRFNHLLGDEEKAWVRIWNKLEM